ERRDELGAPDRDPEGVPGPRRGLDAADGLDDRTLALDHLEEQHVVLERVRADAPVTAVFADVVGDASALIYPAGDGIEADRDRAIAAALAAPDRQRKEGEGLHPVEELGIAITIKPPGLIGEVRGGRALTPPRAVDHEPSLAVCV